VYPEGSGGVIRGRYDAAPLTSSRVGANDDGATAQSGIVTLLDGGIKRVHVDVQNDAARHLHDMAWGREDFTLVEGWVK